MIEKEEPLIDDPPLQSNILFDQLQYFNHERVSDWRKEDYVKTKVATFVKNLEFCQRYP